MQRERWDGGYIRAEADGRRTWVIEREVGGERFHLSTRCHSERAAYEALKRFEADPRAYRAEMAGDSRPAARLVLTAELVLQYRQHMLSRDNPATPRHAREMAHRLSEWVEDLAGRDIRQVQLQELKALVAARRTCKQHRIIAIKGFCTWLRQELCVLDRREDPTLDLVVPQAVPEKQRRRKAVEVARVRAALKELPADYQDCLVVMASTGIHVTELERFVRRPDSELARGRGRVLAVLVTRHKSGDWTRTPLVDPDVVDAAARLRARGAVPRRMNEELRAACERAGVKPFTFGVMRHTVGTWAVERGALPAEVKEFFHHADDRTTRRFYVDAAMPTNVVPLPKFRLGR